MNNKFSKLEIVIICKWFRIFEVLHKTGYNHLPYTEEND